MKMAIRVLSAVLLFGLFPAAAICGGRFDLPPLPPAEEYGNLLIDRASTRSGVKPVGFSHWMHRRKFTCGVCHGELGFALKINSTEIRESDITAGKYCGACHNGQVAFGTVGNCEKCHNGDAGRGKEKFAEIFDWRFPRTRYGNGIDWAQALREGLIAPAAALNETGKPITLDRTLTLEAEWNFVPPAVFPHKAHLAWMGCDACHPEIFQIRKKGTEHFYMSEILKGKFCGICHLRVAFPMDDCVRCHPGMKN